MCFWVLCYLMSSYYNDYNGPSQNAPDGSFSSIQIPDYWSDQIPSGKYIKDVLGVQTYRDIKALAWEELVNQHYTSDQASNLIASSTDQQLLELLHHSDDVRKSDLSTRTFERLDNTFEILHRNFEDGVGKDNAINNYMSAKYGQNWHDPSTYAGRRNLESMANDLRTSLQKPESQIWSDYQRISHEKDTHDLPSEAIDSFTSASPVDAWDHYVSDGKYVSSVLGPETYERILRDLTLRQNLSVAGAKVFEAQARALPQDQLLDSYARYYPDRAKSYRDAISDTILEVKRTRNQQIPSETRAALDARYGPGWQNYDFTGSTAGAAGFNDFVKLLEGKTPEQRRQIAKEEIRNRATNSPSDSKMPSVIITAPTHQPTTPESKKKPMPNAPQPTRP